MRTAIILARPAGTAELAVVAGPSPYNEIRERFRTLRGFDHAEIWTSSGGCVRRKRFGDDADETPAAETHPALPAMPEPEPEPEADAGPSIDHLSPPRRRRH